MDAAPPEDLAKWVGTLLLGSGGLWLIQRMLNGTGRHAEEAQWRDEVKGNLAKVLDAVGELKTAAAVSAKDMVRLEERVEASERRADAQAEAHRVGLADLRAEMDRRLKDHENHCKGV